MPVVAILFNILIQSQPLVLHGYFSEQCLLVLFGLIMLLEIVPELDILRRMGVEDCVGDVAPINLMSFLIIVGLTEIHEWLIENGQVI